MTEAARTTTLVAATAEVLAKQARPLLLVIFETEYFKRPEYPEPEYPPVEVVIPRIYISLPVRERQRWRDTARATWTRFAAPDQADATSVNDHTP